MGPTARDAIIELLRYDRDKCSNKAWARMLCKSFGYDIDEIIAASFNGSTVPHGPEQDGVASERVAEEMAIDAQYRETGRPNVSELALGKTARILARVVGVLYRTGAIDDDGLAELLRE